MLRCAELGLAGTDLDDMTMGMVYDMVMERMNDRADYPLRAGQQQFDSF